MIFLKKKRAKKENTYGTHARQGVYNAEVFFFAPFNKNWCAQLQYLYNNIIYII